MTHDPTNSSAGNSPQSPNLPPLPQTGRDQSEPILPPLPPLPRPDLETNELELPALPPLPTVATTKEAPNPQFNLIIVEAAITGSKWHKSETKNLGSFQLPGS